MTYQWVLTWGASPLRADKGNRKLDGKGVHREGSNPASYPMLGGGRTRIANVFRSTDSGHSLIIVVDLTTKIGCCDK